MDTINSSFRLCTFFKSDKTKRKHTLKIYLCILSMWMDRVINYIIDLLKTDVKMLYIAGTVDSKSRDFLQFSICFAKKNITSTQIALVQMEMTDILKV